jgi:glucose/arabinose dehydrogenase
VGRRLASLLTIGLLAAASVPLLLASPAAAATFPSGFTDTTVAGSLGAATALAQLPDGRFLVTSQTGQLRVVAGSSSSLALDLHATVDVTHPDVCGDSEEGLLGVTVDPQFATNGFVYLYYTRAVNGSCSTPGNASGGAVNRVSRFTMAGNTIDRSTENVLLDNMPEWGGNHDGGYVHVAHDGTLFVSVGDGGAGRPDTNPADFSLPNGKILRINTNGSIPAGNPHGTTTCGTTWGSSGVTCGEIYSDGLRNPFRLAFKDDDPGVTFRINDVGDSTWEEVDEGIAGAHYGWPCREGPASHGSSAPCNQPVTDPTFWYNHSTGCNVITAGAYVPAGAWQGYDGAYLFADNGCGEMFAGQPGTSGAGSPTLATGLEGITDMAFFKTGGSWALYYTTYAGGGQLHKVIGPASNGVPPAIPNMKFSPLQPTRLLDTRAGTGVAAGKLAAGGAITLKVSGGAVPADAKAVVLNLTATLADGAGFVTAWPTGQPQPPTSSLNVSTAGETAANAVVVPVGQDGQVNFFTFAGTHLVADVTGYFSDAGSTTNGRFHATTGPTRLLDTRSGLGGKTGAFTAGQSFDLQVGGKAGVPADATGVALTVTYTGPTAPGYLTVWPTGQPQPLASTTNPNGVGDIRSNLAMIPLGAGGKVGIFSFAPTDVVIDVVGYFSSGSGTTGLFTVVTPARVADSRQASAPFGRIPAAGEVTMDFSTVVAGDATAALYNLTATNTVAGGYLTAHPSGTPVPEASSVNWSAGGQSRAALTISSLAAAKKVGLFALTPADAVLDLSGWFSS